MLSFSPSSKLEKALKSLQVDIVLLAQELSTMDEAEKSWLSKSVLISTIGASTRIENAALTDAEIEWVDTTLTQDGKTTAYQSKRTFILNKLSKDRERSIEEVVGCREVLNLLYIQTNDFFPLTESTIRGMHKILLSYYPKASPYAGRYKPNPNLVVSVNHDSGERRTVLEPTPPGPLTEAAMRDLITWYNSVIEEYPWTILVATEFVFRFLAIHPFQDGNGRIGRALFLLALMQGDDPALKQVVHFISIDRQIERNRPLYYSALQNVSGGHYRVNPEDYNLEPLAWFFLKMIQNALDDVTMLRQRYTAMIRLSEGANKVLACFKSSPEKRLSVSELVQETGLVRRSVQNALVNLVKAGFLQRLGIGPSSRYQLIF
ncbi:MAG TPA: Fic family protein [Alphaproteobacteria bacterium]|nr:Fic family protein [Alphaproteobacteria bacterium]